MTKQTHSLFNICLPVLASLYLASCAPTQFGDISVNLEIKTQLVELKSGPEGHPTLSFATYSAELQAEQSLDPRDMCLWINATAPRLTNSTARDSGGGQCFSPELAVPFPGFGKATTFIDLANPLQKLSPLSTGIGPRNFDLVGVPKTSFSDHRCPEGKIEFRSAAQEDLKPLLFVDGLKYDKWNPQPSKASNSGIVIFAHAYSVILPQLSSLELIVSNDSTDRWLAKNYSCDDGGIYPQIAYATKVISANDLLTSEGSLLRPIVKNHVDTCFIDDASGYLSRGQISIDPTSCAITVIANNSGINIPFNVVAINDSMRATFPMIYYGGTGGIARVERVLKVGGKFNQRSSALRADASGRFFGELDATTHDQILIEIKNIGNQALTLSSASTGGVPDQYPTAPFIPRVADLSTEFPWGSTGPFSFTQESLSQTVNLCDPAAPLSPQTSCYLPLIVQGANGCWQQQLSLANTMGQKPLVKILEGQASMISSSIRLCVYNAEDVGTLSVDSAESAIVVKKVDLRSHSRFVDKVILDRSATSEVIQDYEGYLVNLSGIILNSDAMAQLLTRDTLTGSLLAQLTKYIAWGVALKNPSHVPVQIQSISTSYDSPSYNSSIVFNARNLNSDETAPLAGSKYSCLESATAAEAKDLTNANIILNPEQTMNSDDPSAGHLLSGNFAYDCLTDPIDSAGTTAFMKIKYFNGVFEATKQVTINFLPDPLTHQTDQ